jgi:hypothetical protein
MVGRCDLRQSRRRLSLHQRPQNPRDELVCLRPARLAAEQSDGEESGERNVCSQFQRPLSVSYMFPKPAARYQRRRDGC